MLCICNDFTGLTDGRRYLYHHKDDDEISDSGRVDSISWISGVIETGTV